MSNMPNIDDCCDLNYRLGENYNKIELLMSDIYDKQQAGATIDLTELLLHLGEIGQSMLFTQREFVETYGKSDIKTQTIMSQQIDNKIATLASANDQLRGNSY